VSLNESSSALFNAVYGALCNLPKVRILTFTLFLVAIDSTVNDTLNAYECHVFVRFLSSVFSSFFFAHSFYYWY
jgi:hypothetical protein